MAQNLGHCNCHCHKLYRLGDDKLEFNAMAKYWHLNVTNQILLIQLSYYYYITFDDIKNIPINSWLCSDILAQ